MVYKLPQNCFPHVGYKIGLEARYNKDGELILNNRCLLEVSFF